MAQTFANDTATTWNTKFKKVKVDVITATVAMYATLAPTTPFQLLEIRYHADGASAAEDLTITLDANAGAAYDAVLHTKAMSGLTDYYYNFASEMRFFGAGDKLVFAHTNTNTATFGLEVVYCVPLNS